MNWPPPPFPIPLCCSGEGGREIGNEVKPVKGKEGGEGVLRFSFYFSLSFSDLLGIKTNLLIKLISPSQVWFACDSN